MAIYTAGFAAWTAEQFFDALSQHQVTNLVDVRLNNTSQLSGFAKKLDLVYFLQKLCGAEYFHEPLLAPTSDLLKNYRKGLITWVEYEKLFCSLLQERRVEHTVSKTLFSGSPLLLCSEHSPEKCHRRLVVDYLNLSWGYNAEVVHIV